MSTIKERDTSKNHRLYQIAARYWPFSRMSMESLSGIPIKRIILSRKQLLEPRPGHLYLVLEGTPIEVLHTPRGTTMDAHHYAPGEIMGWWAVEGFIRHARETHYIVLTPDWIAYPELEAVRTGEVIKHLARTKEKLALFAAGTVEELVCALPRTSNETITDYARRLGRSREMVSKVLTRLKAAQA